MLHTLAKTFMAISTLIVLDPWIVIFAPFVQQLYLLQSLQISFELEGLVTGFVVVTCYYVYHLI